MKTPRASCAKRFRLYVRCIALLLGAFGSGVPPNPVSAAVQFTVNPASAPGNYAGVVEVTAQGLQPGETVLLRRWLDVQGNGVLETNQDLLVVELRITDNIVPVLAGVTNWSRPFDQDPGAGIVRVLLNYYTRYLDHAVGTHLWELSSPNGRFAPLFRTQVFTIAPMSQGVSGVVRSGGSAVSGAMVVALDVLHDVSLAGSALCDAFGRYELRLPPGLYILLAAKPGWVTDIEAAPLLQLAEGQMASTDLELLTSTRWLSGRLVNATNPALGLPAIFLQVDSDSGLFAPAWTDNNGNFTVAVRSGRWRIEPAHEDLALHGFLFAESQEEYLTSTGHVSGIQIKAQPANAAFFGRVLDTLGQPVPGFRLRVNGFTDGIRFDGHDPVTDDQGRYVGMAVGGTSTWWNVVPDFQLNPLLANQVVSGLRFEQSFGPGQAVAADFQLARATNRLAGQVRDVQGQPVPGITVIHRTVLSGQAFYGSTVTDPNGRYFTSLAGQQSEVHLHCDDLLDAGLNCAPSSLVKFLDSETTLDFVVFPQPTPGLSHPMRTGPNQFQFRVHGMPFTTYEVEVSSDLRQWQRLGTVTPSREGGPFYSQAVFTDSSATTGPRFYRLRRR
ncbi:MAG: hypothetical protein RMN51_09230 [Verrucomicrobiota bacterium]|nr:hypothetical protein [Limisphaera sp.]MDW8382273.1 hypothetical protein [Verrucomicrobiota bacterium]